MVLQIEERCRRESEEAGKRQNKICKRTNLLGSNWQKEELFHETEDVEILIQEQKQADRVSELEKSVSTMKTSM